MPLPKLSGIIYHDNDEDRAFPIPEAIDYYSGEDESDEDDLIVDYYLGTHIVDSPSSDTAAIQITPPQVVNDLVRYCPYSATYFKKSCPFGDMCALEKICHFTSRSKGCRKTNCKFAHEIKPSCPGIVKRGYCDPSLGLCEFNHDLDVCTTFWELSRLHLSGTYGLIQGTQVEADSESETRVAAEVEVEIAAEPEAAGNIKVEVANEINTIALAEMKLN